MKHSWVGIQSADDVLSNCKNAEKCLNPGQVDYSEFVSEWI